MYEEYSSIPTLTHEQTCELARAGRRDKIVEHNMRLVFKVKNSFGNNNKVDDNDLMQVGVLGLIKAVEKFNPDLPSPLGVLAFRYIKGYMLNALGSNHFKYITLLDDFKTDGDSNSKPNDEAIMDETPNVDEKLMKMETINGIKLAMEKASLTSKERKCIEMKFGFGPEGTKPLSISETARQMGYSAVGVSVTFNKAMRKIRKQFKQHECMD